MSDSILREQHSTWKKKPVTRAIYTDFYNRIIARARPGLSLEIGGGSGNLKEFARDVVSTDIVAMSWLDAAADAQSLPFPDNTFMNIVSIDVLHHIEHPLRFMAEAERTLQPGGRLLLIEPAITPGSWLFYKYFHPEPVMLNANPLMDGPGDPARHPFDANQAIPTLLFGRYREELRGKLPTLHLVYLERFSFFAYPLSGGFRNWSLIPVRSIDVLLRIENCLTPLIGRVAAFRLFAVLEKKEPTRD